MSNKLKKEIKNKWVEVKGLYQSKGGMVAIPITVNCIITNDSKGKTLSVGTEQVILPYLLKLLKNI